MSEAVRAEFAAVRVRSREVPAPRAHEGTGPMPVAPGGTGFPGSPADEVRRRIGERLDRVERDLDRRLGRSRGPAPRPSGAARRAREVPVSEIPAAEIPAGDALAAWFAAPAVPHPPAGPEPSPPVGGPQELPGGSGAPRELASPVGGGPRHPAGRRPGQPPSRPSRRWSWAPDPGRHGAAVHDPAHLAAQAVDALWTPFRRAVNEFVDRSLSVAESAPPPAAPLPGDMARGERMAWVGTCAEAMIDGMVGTVFARFFTDLERDLPPSRSMPARGGSGRE